MTEEEGLEEEGLKIKNDVLAFNTSVELGESVVEISE